MLDRQLVLADTHRRHAGIDHQVVADVVEHRGTRQRRPVLLCAEGPLQRLPGRQASGRAIDRPHSKTLPARCRPATAEGLDGLLIEVDEHLLRQALARFGEGRARRDSKGHDHTEHGREEALQLQLGAAFAQVEHQRHETVEGPRALTREGLRVQAEARDHVAPGQSLPYALINRFE